MTSAPTKRPKKRRTFGHTWWGTAWVEALEERARLDRSRLPRGRTYARTGRVGPLTVEPGEVRASVRGSRPSHYAVRIRVRQLDRREWESVLDAMAAQGGHLAALLDGELPPDVVADVADAGIDLLPGPGELRTRCTCPDWAEPCKHSAAVCYLMADVLDDDPFALLLLRGRTREELLAGLRRRRTGDIAGDALPRRGRPVPDQGVDARERWAAVPAPLPRLPLPPARPGHPAVLAVDPPPESGLDSAELRALAADAARRAWELLVGEGDGGLSLSVEADLGRRAAAVPIDELEALAKTSGVPGRRLFRLRRAWEAGREEAVAAAEQRRPDRWRTAPDGSLQLRPGSSGRWFPFEPDGDGWLAAGPAVEDPDAVLVPVARRPPFWERDLSEKERRAYMFGAGWFQDLDTMPPASPIRFLIIDVLASQGRLVDGAPIAELAEACREAVARNPALLGTLDTRSAAAAGDPSEWRKLWRPHLTGWVRARKGNPRWFRLSGDRLEPELPIAPGCEREFTAMTLDAVRERLAR